MPVVDDPGAPASSNAAALALLASLFFMWGFITVLNDVLIPHLKAVFDLDYAQSLLIQFVWFIAYGIASLPAARVIERIGYRRAMVVGLVVMAAGATGFVPAARFASYPIFLGALFVLACGVTLLQVAANPYVTAVGPARTASFRLNLVQGFNSLGTFIAPAFGAALILGRSASGTQATAGAALSGAQRLSDAQSVQLPYLLIAAVLVAIALVVARSRLPEPGAATRRLGAAERRGRTLLAHRNLVLGVPAIGLYVLAEIGVGSLLIAFARQPDVAGLSAREASGYLTWLWGGMMVGRFAGAFVMRAVAPERLLALCAAASLALVLAAVFGHGYPALYALVAVGLFHSVMFPTIFALGVRGLGPLTEEGSGLLVTAIAGGALAIGQAQIADRYGLHLSFLVPAACELFILFYALWGCRGPAEPSPDETFG